MYRASLAQPDGDAVAAWAWLATQLQAHFGIDPNGLRRYGAMVTKSDGELPYSEGERIVGEEPSRRIGSEPATMDASLALGMMEMCNDSASQHVELFARRIDEHERCEADRGETRLFDSLLSEVVKRWPGLSFPAIESKLPSTFREPKLISHRDAAELVEVSERTIERRLDDRTLTAHGPDRKVDQAELLDRLHLVRRRRPRRTGGA